MKDDVDDLCRRNQLPLVSIDTTTSVISLSDLNNKHLRVGDQQNCLNISFDETNNICPVRVPNAISDNSSDRTSNSNGINLKGPGFRSKEENKTPIAGVPAV